MDRFVKTWDYVNDADLNVCDRHGVAYQADMTKHVPYDPEYFAKCAKYEAPEKVARNMVINGGRIDLVHRHHGQGPVLDIGIGSGTFIKRRLQCGAVTFGVDVNPQAVEWLNEQHLYSDKIETFQAFTMWDVIEHLPDPGVYLDKIPKGSFLFVSVPVFRNLMEIRSSRHYRPDEHLYYWTDAGFDSVIQRGFVYWMGLRDFVLLERSDFETKAGRNEIMTYAFRKGGK